jgi:hypothetical protein
MRNIFSRLRSIDSQGVQTIAAVANVILAMAAVVGSIAVALYVHYSQQRAERLSYFHSLGQAWISVDLAALSDDQLLVTADNLMDPANIPEPSIERRRKRWFAYAVMNLVLARYKGAEDGILVPKEEVVAGCRNMLSTLMRDDDIYMMTQGHGYEPWMQEVCRELRQEYMASRTSAIEESRLR